MLFEKNENIVFLVQLKCYHRHKSGEMGTKIDVSFSTYNLRHSKNLFDK